MLKGDPSPRTRCAGEPKRLPQRAQLSSSFTQDLAPFIQDSPRFALAMCGITRSIAVSIETRYNITCFLARVFRSA